MGSPSPAAAAGKVKKESSSSSGSKVGVTTPHRRTSSSVASSCLSEELQDVQSPVRSVNGLGKSPVAATSPRTPASGTSPAALKKRRASIGGADDLARGLDFSSPSTEEKKHSFLTKGGGHKKVATPAKVTTPPPKEKVVVARATIASVLSPRKLGEVKKDSPRKSVLASEGNESGNGEGTTPKKASPKVVAAAKSSPRPTVKPVASTKKSTNGESESPLEVSPVKSLRKSITSLPSLKLKPGLTSPRAQKGVKTSQDTPAQPGRVKRRIEKAVPVEEVEVASVCSTNGNETESFDVVTKVDEEGSSLLPSLMEDGDVGDEDMNSLEQGADPGFENDTDMPTSWLSEDLPCMFSSLSSLPEPDDSSSSVLGDPLELLDEPEELVSELSNTNDENSVAAEHPRAIDKAIIESERNSIELDRVQEDEPVSTIEQTVMAEPSIVSEKASTSNSEASFQKASVEPTKVEVPKSEVECDTFTGENVPYVYISEGGALQEERNARPAEEEILVSSSDDEDLIDGSCSAQLNLKQSFDEAAEADEKEHIATEECSVVEQKVTEPEATKFTPTTHLDKDMMIFDFEEYWTHNVGDESSHYDAGHIDADEAKVPTPVAAKSFIPIELPVSSLSEEESMVSPSSKSIPVEESDEDEVFHVYKISAQSSPKDVRPEELIHAGDFDSRYTTLDTEQCNGVEKPGEPETNNVENVTNLGQDSSVDALQSAAADDRETAAQAEDLDAAPRFLAVTSNGLLGANIQVVDENGSEDPPISPVTVPLSSQASPFEALDDDSSSMPEEFAKTTNDRDDDVKELQSGKSFATPISEVAAEPGVLQDFISTSKLEGGDNAHISGEKVASVESNSSMPPVIGINEEEQTEAHFLMSLDNTEESAHTTCEQLLGLVGYDKLISASTEKLRVDEARVPEDEILSAEKPRELQAHGDEPIEASLENLSEVDHRPSISTSEPLQDDNYEVTIDKSLQLRSSSDPVFDQEDEITNDSKLDVESEELHAKPTVPLEEADVRSTMVVTAAEETTNHTDTTQNLEEAEEIYSTTASPFVVPAGELSKLALNESGEFDDRSEGTADEEERGGFKEQKTRAEQVLEEEEADSKPSTEVEKDLSSAELVVNEAALVADAKYDTPEDVEIGVDESKEASRNTSSPISTPSDIIESHDQEGHIPLGAQTDPISKAEAALETEKVLEPSLDADFDDVEIAQDQFSSEDLPLEPCVPSDLKTSRSTADSNETEISDLTRYKEGENLSENLDTVMDIPQNLFVPSSLDADVDESEEKSALPCKSEETKQEGVSQEDDEICGLKTTSLHGTSQAENPETALVNDVENHSSNGDHKEESLSEELSVDSPTDLVSFSSQNNGTRTTPWIDESEEAGKVEESLPKRTEVVSGEDTARSIVNEMEEHSSVDARDTVEHSSVDVKDMEEDLFVQESLNGRLTRDEDEDQVVHSPKSQRHVEETPNTSTSSTTHIQDQLSRDDKVEEDVKKESLLEDDDTVMYRPDLGESSPEAVEKVEESLPRAMEEGEELPQTAVEELKEISTVSEDTVEYRPTSEESIKMVDSPMEVFNVPQNAAIVDDEEQDDERLNGNVDNTMQHLLAAKDQPTANQLAAADEMEKQTEKEVEALPRSQELEGEEMLLESSEELSIASDATKTSALPLANELEKEESTSQAPSMFEVENSEEPYVTPILLNANTPNSGVSDDLEKTTETLEKSMLEVEESSEEAAVAPELLTAKAVVPAESKPKQTETSDEKSIDLMEVANPKELSVVPDKDNAVVMTLTGEELDGHPTDKESLNGIHHEEEPILKAQVDSPSDNLKEDMVLNDAIPSSDGIVVPHGREVEVADAAHLIEVPTPTAAAKDSQAPDVRESSTTVSEKQNNATNLECMQANTNSQADPELDSEPHTPTEPQSPTATLYPLLKPPFSGSQQDRLWEEQAEAYNSGQGTPSRNACHAGASSPATMVTVLSDSCEDQIQPATNSNGNHAAAAAAAVSSNGAAASHENGNIPNQDLALKERNGKDKLHTPLRSLLLEDAHNNNAITPNGVSSSPSFIRRLFRVMSTSSRSAEREASNAKLKKSSSSMWVSCLGSPQVQP